MFVIFLAGMACELTPNNNVSTDTPEVSEDTMATSVAATLTAVAGGEGEAPGETPDETPGESPGETPDPPTATPTNTPEPQPLRVAYIDNDNLQLWTEGAGSVMLYTGEKVDDLIISDDGQVIVFKTIDTNWIPQGLYRINSDGTNLIQLMTGAEFAALNTDPNALSADIYSMAFVPGSYDLTFNTKLIFEGPGLIIQDDIMQVDTNTGLVTVLFTPSEPCNFYYSPDGTQIALSDHNSISLINADGTNLRPDVLSFPMVNTASEYLLYPPPTWAPDSTYLRVVIPSPEPWGPGAFMTVYHIPTDGSAAASIGVFSGLPIFSFQGGMISPDMQTLVYHTQFGPPTDNLYELHLVNLAGGVDTVYATGPQTMMGWGPDSEHFVYGRSGEPTLLGRIGFGSMALTDVVTVNSVAWVDSTRFVFTAYNAGAWQIRLGSLGAPSSLIAAPTGNFIVFDFSN
jgi:hypothetical protein